MSRRYLSLLLAAFAIASLSASGDTRQARRDAESMKQKVAAINEFAERPGKLPRRTLISESEVNAYLALEAREQIPVGVVDPSIAILGTGRLSGHAVVDLDVVRKQHKATSLFDPMTFLGGRVMLTASGVLTTSNGVGHFVLEEAAIGSVPVPKLLLQEILGYYSRTPDKPGGIGLDDPFSLPARIREIRVQQRGQAVVVQ
jgi:hypothetical protein